MRKGISLIVLVITIIVMIIIASVIILSLTNSHLVGKANEAVFKTNVKAYQSELNLWISNEKAKDSSGFDIEEVNRTGESMREIITSMKDEHIEKFAIEKGKLVYIGNDESEKNMVASAGIPILSDTTKPVISLLGSNPMSVDQNSAYTEPGAICTDDRDTDIQSKLVITGTVDTSTVGSYTVTYNVLDSAGNAAVTVTRTVNVEVGILGINVVAPDNVTVNGQSPSYNNPIIPKGFKAINTPDASWDNLSTDWDNGLVIQDASGNEFVWVPIYGTITYAKWCTSYRAYNNVNISDDIFPEDLNEITLANKYKGFYIGRYEASFDFNEGNYRARSMKSTTVKTSSWTKGSGTTGYIWNFINYANAKKYAEAMDGVGETGYYGYQYDTTKVGTALLTGTQWDTVMKWINTTTANYTGKSVTSSLDWGNYNNATFTYEHPTSGTKEINTSTLLNTGAANRNKAKNIYDLAGNLAEWTNEKYGTSYNIIRGGAYGAYGETNPAAYRYEYSTSIASVGFRIALYVK